MKLEREVLGIGPNFMVCTGYDDRIYWDDPEICDITRDELKRMAEIAIDRWQKLLEKIDDEA